MTTKITGKAENFTEIHVPRNVISQDSGVRIQQGEHSSWDHIIMFLCENKHSFGHKGSLCIAVPYYWSKIEGDHL